MLPHYYGDAKYRVRFEALHAEGNVSIVGLWVHTCTCVPRCTYCYCPLLTKYTCTETTVGVFHNDCTICCIRMHTTNDKEVWGLLILAYVLQYTEHVPGVNLNTYIMNTRLHAFALNFMKIKCHES